MNTFSSSSLLLMFISLYASSSTGKRTISNNATSIRICETSGCYQAARLILENINTTIDPCGNFYQFACGKYVKESTIREDKISASRLGQADDRIKEQLKESIEDNILENDCRTLHLLQSHYNSCLDTEKIERSSIEILLDILSRLGGWPVHTGKSWNESVFDWKRLIYQLRRIGYVKSMNSLIKFTVATDEKNNTIYVIELDQAETALAREYLVEGLKNEVVQAYYKYMMNVVGELGVDTRHAKRELLGWLLFEIELAKISSPVEERRDKSQLYNPMTVEELQSKYPDIPWKEYINEFLRPHYIVESSERVIVRNTNYLRSVTELISKTPKHILANYIIWRVVEESAPYLNKRVQNAKAKFMVSVTGTEVQQPRWGECIDYVSNYLPLAVGALYVRKVFDKDAKKEVEELVEKIRESYKKSLERVDWMDLKTKRFALKKLKLMHAHVAYPDELLDDEKLNGHFEHLREIPNNYLDSYLSVSLFDLDDVYRQYRLFYNKTEWISHGSVAVVNAFYQFSENSLQIPAGFLQEELFVMDRPNYMNYAGIGYFIGHEMTHAFDDEGSQYDEEGNLINWWDRKTQKEYQKRAQCIVDQYSNYTVKDVNMKINGINTQGENIADNGGVKQAYFAYEECERQNGPEPRLPGLNYSPRQLFWITNANVYCEVFRPEALENQIIIDEHCPGEFRIIGAFSNIPEFARDFECPLGSFMNPVKKCPVW